MTVVVFDSETKAYEAEDALKQLDKDGSISVYAGSVIKKNSDGRAEILKTVEEFPVRTASGTAIGSLIGLLGGPVGVIVGATAGTLSGAFVDLYRSGVSAEFVDEVSSKLTAGKFALVADISEEWMAPLDTKMTSLGGVIYRTPKDDVEVDQIDRDIAALDAEISQTETEAKQSLGERKADLQARLKNLREKRQKKIDDAKQRAEQRDRELNAKLKALKEKIANNRGKTKAAIDARRNHIKSNYERTLTKWKNLRAEKLKKKADQLEEKSKKMSTQTTSGS